MLAKVAAIMEQPYQLLVWLLLIYLPIDSPAHTVVLSKYNLSHNGDGWVLSFTQKTSQLRDAVYSLRPDLKGTNLNSDDFLEATSRYIADNFTLEYQDELLGVTPKFMRYSGLEFEGQFLVVGLPKNPHFLTITTSGFDEHEHSIKLLRIVVGEQGHLYYFRNEQYRTVFSFESKRFDMPEMEKTQESSSTNLADGTLMIYLFGLLVVLGLGLGLFSGRLSAISPKST